MSLGNRSIFLEVKHTKEACAYLLIEMLYCLARETADSNETTALN